MVVLRDDKAEARRRAARIVNPRVIASRWVEDRRSPTRRRSLPALMKFRTADHDGYGTAERDGCTGWCEDTGVSAVRRPLLNMVDMQLTYDRCASRLRQTCWRIATSSLLRELAHREDCQGPHRAAG